ncbi:MAG: histidine phosphatase family protein [Planctomycetales bacterium]|nr:histidine phosphatase family protein [Planctomycetales bacterium]
MIVYCIRHGESLFNAEGRIQGQLDTQLSPHGIRQSATLAEYLAAAALDAIVASPLQRAMMTAQPLAAATGLAIHTDDRLMEINAGVFQGLCWREIDARFPEEMRRWRSHDPDFVIPDGESRRELMERGHAALADVCRLDAQRVAVVAHGGVLTAGFKGLLGIPADRNPFALENCSISRLEWRDGHPQLRTLNETAHLAEVNRNHAGHRGDL